jgi:ketosteroid isomerase-like protein
MTTRDIVTAYIQAIEAHDLPRVAALLHPDVVTVEHPNRINPAGKRYDAAAMREAGERGKAVMAREEYAIRQLIVEGDRAAVQIEWTGTLTTGQTMRAQICSIIEVRDGRIWRQEQYDCFV